VNTLSMSEIIDAACKLSTDEEKVEYLKQHESVPLKNFFALMYDKEKFKFNIPKTTPPYAASEYPDSHGMLFREMRKMKYFIVGGAGDNLPQARREAIFIQILESVDKHDAKLLCKMITQKPMKALPVEVITQAFGPIITGKQA
jgi:hypothetical protein